jgi:hypothetical protein
MVALVRSEHRYKIYKGNKINAIDATLRELAFVNGCFYASRDKTAL